MKSNIFKLLASKMHTEESSTDSVRLWKQPHHLEQTLLLSQNVSDHHSELQRLLLKNPLWDEGNEHKAEMSEFNTHTHTWLIWQTPSMLKGVNTLMVSGGLGCFFLVLRVPTLKKGWKFSFWVQRSSIFSTNHIIWVLLSRTRPVKKTI